MVRISVNNVKIDLIGQNKPFKVKIDLIGKNQPIKKMINPIGQIQPIKIKILILKVRINPLR